MCLRALCELPRIMALCEACAQSSWVHRCTVRIASQQHHRKLLLPLNFGAAFAGGGRELVLATLSTPIC